MEGGYAKNETCYTRHKNSVTLNKFNRHTLGVISLTLVPAKKVYALPRGDPLGGGSVSRRAETLSNPNPFRIQP